jgi:hypothetical protein
LLAQLTSDDELPKFAMRSLAAQRLKSRDCGQAMVATMTHFFASV